MSVWLTRTWWHYQIRWRFLYWRWRVTGVRIVWNGPMQFDAMVHSTPARVPSQEER